MLALEEGQQQVAGGQNVVSDGVERVRRQRNRRMDERTCCWLFIMLGA